MLFFSVGNGAMNALLCDIGNRAIMPANKPRLSYPYSAMNFMTAMAIRILRICQQLSEMAWNL